jgi:hypothetical protein
MVIVFCEKLTVAQLAKTLMPSEEPKDSLPWRQQPATGLYPEPDEANNREGRLEFLGVRITTSKPDINFKIQGNE